MERKKLTSGNILSAGYDARNRVLEVELRDGAVYQYSGVSSEVHRRLMNAPSPGSYFRDEIEEAFSAKRLR